MNNVLDMLWNEYYAEKCAEIVNEEDRMLAKMAVEERERLDNFLTNEGVDALEEYIAVLFEIQSLLIKNAFFRGCKFAVSVFIDIDKIG